ncbi:MAG: XRE family transcriptional regulator [Pseudomonadota bacterium]|uniref:helix-turn-helix domain-containing protein n=1 Tax=Sphingomonas sp. ERG5 TaxID=1381597 RepID=UPI00054B6040|nr:XRE family transcriptional regulator [Sphingomonas sp. ERG5]
MFQAVSRLLDLVTFDGDVSAMADFGSPQIGPAVQQHRKKAGMTLDVLSHASGVSRSMLSQIERGQTNPTVATVWALAQALKIDVSELIGGARPERRPHIEVASPSFTPEIRTEDGSCVLRILSPADRADSLEWYEIRFAAGGKLTSAAHAHGTREHLTVLDGELHVTLDGAEQIVGHGATARYPADIPHEIINLGTDPARALLVVIG